MFFLVFLGFFRLSFVLCFEKMKKGCWVNGSIGRIGSTRYEVDWVMEKIGQFFGPLAYN